MIRCLIVLLISLAAGDALACSRCGLFGRRCRFASHVDHHVAVAPVVAAPQTLILQNNYNAPNGAAALIAPQGGTVYGLQAAALPYRLDPDAVLRQAAELTRGAQSLADQGLRGYSQTASLALTLQASQPAIQAAALTAPVAVQSRQQTLSLTQQSDGTWAVRSSDEQIPAAAPEPKPEERSIPGPASAIGGLVRKHCGRCHGTEKPDPKGGLYYDQGHELDCRSALSAVKAVTSGKMPKGAALSPEDKGALVAELIQLGKVE
jgi:hypothetical protein